VELGERRGLATLMWDESTRACVGITSAYLWHTDSVIQLTRATHVRRSPSEWTLLAVRPVRSYERIVGMTRTLPFLKWPGGKRWAAGEIADIIRPHLKRQYYEPFLGGGAVFFALQPHSALLSDINADLVNVFKEVKRRPNLLVSMLKDMEVSASEYKRIRKSSPECSKARATRFLYLNRTAFSGMFRLNRQGEFNVPYGGGARNPEILWRDGLLKKASLALKNASIVCSDFENSLATASLGDVVYCDPTYTVAHDNNGFCRYNESVFSWQDQIRLATQAANASKRGAFVIVSNANHSSVLELYSGLTNCEVQILERFSCISRDTSHRRPVSESLFILRPHFLLTKKRQRGVSR